MDKNIVETIINTEKELEELIVCEREKMYKALEIEKSSYDMKVALEEEKYKRLTERSIEQEILKTEKDGEHLIGEAQKTAMALENMNDELIIKIIRKYIKKILENHDC